MKATAPAINGDLKKVLHENIERMLEIRALSWASYELLLNCSDLNISKEERIGRVAALAGLITQRSDLLADGLDKMLYELSD